MVKTDSTKKAIGKTAKNAPAKTAKKAPATKAAPKRTATDVDSVLALLKSKATKRTLDGMARYGIPSEHAWGVTLADIRAIAKNVGRDHALAGALWDTGVYEARMLAAFVEEPERVTVAQMDRWCRDFDNWAIVDTHCFHLFDRTPHAFGRVSAWADDEEEFVKRAAFALLASLGGHHEGDHEAFAPMLALIERASVDERNFVKKGVSWALRMIGRRTAALHAASLSLARRLSTAKEPSARFIGKEAVKDLSKPAVARRFAP